MQNKSENPLFYQKDNDGARVIASYTAPVAQSRTHRHPSLDHLLPTNHRVRWCFTGRQRSAKAAKAAIFSICKYKMTAYVNFLSSFQQREPVDKLFVRYRPGER
ncbi:hypothetical protein J6590_101856 [Homalodisca vitripennis]|nr:hypothetical protein J6590_101856 [Homalodisca vitripennis]